MFQELEIRAKLGSGGKAFGWERRRQEKGESLISHFPLWAVLPDFKHCPGFLNRAIREIRAKIFSVFLAFSAVS